MSTRRMDKRLPFRGLALAVMYASEKIEIDDVREARTRAGWTQHRLAQSAGISESYLRMIEAGLQPSPRTFGRIRRALARAIGDE